MLVARVPAEPPPSMVTLLDHRITLAYLVYLGYPDEPRIGALVTRPRKHDHRIGKSSCSVFLCYICRAAGSGKTSLFRSFAGKHFSDMYEPTEKVLSMVNSVDVRGSEKYLVVGHICVGMYIDLDRGLRYLQLQEFGTKYEPEVLRNSKKTDLVDVVVYVHDSSDTNSFSYISNLRVGGFRCSSSVLTSDLTPSLGKQQYSLDHIPILFVATKSDLDLAQQVGLEFLYHKAPR